MLAALDGQISISALFTTFSTNEFLSSKIYNRKIIVAEDEYYKAKNFRTDGIITACFLKILFPDSLGSHRLRFLCCLYSFVQKNEYDKRFHSSILH